MTTATVTPNQLELVNELRVSVMQKAETDAAFRAELLANPKAAVEKLTGAALPAGHTIQVLQESPTSWAVVLPYEARVGAAGELSDSDLESVAGGSKAGANAFFNGIGNFVKSNPVTVGSTIGGFIPFAGKAISTGCKIGTHETGQH